MFKETPEGQTHYWNDGCGCEAHNLIENQTKSAARFVDFMQKMKYLLWTAAAESDRKDTLFPISEKTLDAIAMELYQYITVDREE